MSREKGKRGERELAHELNRLLGTDARRGQQFNGSDGSADVVGLPGIHIECKRVESLRLTEAMEQATSDARPDERPAVFHRRNGKPWVVAMHADDFMRMYARVFGGPYTDVMHIVQERASLYDRLERHAADAKRKYVPALSWDNPGKWHIMALYLDGWAAIYGKWLEATGGAWDG